MSLKMILSGFAVRMIEDCYDLEKFLKDYDGIEPADNSIKLIESALTLYYNFLMKEARKHGYKPVKEDK